MTSEYPRGQRPEFIHQDELGTIGVRAGFSIAIVSDMEDGQRLAEKLGLDKVVTAIEFIEMLDAVTDHNTKEMKIAELMKMRSNALVKWRMLHTAAGHTAETVLVVYPCDGTIDVVAIHMPTVAYFVSDSVWVDKRLLEDVTTQDDKCKRVSLITGHRSDLPKMSNPAFIAVRDSPAYPSGRVIHL